MARPKKRIDGDEVEKLAAMFCTDVEIARWFDSCDRTIRRRFRDRLDRGRSLGKMSLKRKQFELAQGGNITMLIWLGKQYLEQSDKVEQRIRDEAGTKPIEKMTDAELTAELAKHESKG